MVSKKGKGKGKGKKEYDGERTPTLFGRVSESGEYLYAHGIVENGHPDVPPKGTDATFVMLVKVSDLKALISGRKEWIFMNVVKPQAKEEEQDEELGEDMDDVGGDW